MSDKIPFPKEHKNIEEQIQQLLERGLIIEDKNEVRKFLFNVSYARVKPYMFRYQIMHDSNHGFNTSTKWEDIVYVYEFDAELKHLLFKAIEKFEVAFRTTFSYYYSEFEKLQFPEKRPIAWWFEYDTYFKKPHLHFEHCEHLKSQVKRSKQTDPQIRNYFKKYDPPKNPPSWFSFENLTFGLISKLYENANTLYYPKKEISKHFGILDPDVLASWVHCISLVRNICAHHSRLWDSHFHAIPTIPKKNIGNFPRFTKSHRLYPNICVLLYLLKSTGHFYLFRSELINLIRKYSEINIEQMGFPIDWLTDEFWIE
ncbi:MAG: Abi family protein [Bacteroidia bacterium]|nr:Abi family protein [Bacteroidia bacterium]